MMTMTSRLYNTTDNPLHVDDDGSLVEARAHVRVKDVDAEPIASHLAAGRLIDVTDAKAEGAEAEEQLADQVVEPDPAPTKGGRKSTTTTARS